MSITTDISIEQAQQIMNTARTAFADLQKTTVRERCQELKKVMRHFYQTREQIIDRIVEENGKARTDALVSDIMSALDALGWLTEQAPKILSDSKVPTPLMLMGKKSKIYHQALGACLVITPWNYPINNGIIFTMTGFIAGCSVIFKPSEHTPLKGVFEEIFSASPLIKNSIQMVYGQGMSAKHIIDQRPDKIFFTGSTRTGKKIMAQASEYLIPVELELGGKDPAIVFDDVNIQRTAAGILWGALTNAGQSCTSIEKLYVHERIYDPFVDALKSECEKLIVNNQDNGDADIGAITVPFQKDIISRHVEDARAKGATIVCGGTTIGEHFYAPTIITHIPEDAVLNSEETFGPLIPVYKFKSEQEVLDLEAKSEFGLSASIWSKDLDRADRMARALQVGAVSINNVMLTEGQPFLPFGGRKQSGFGRVHGAEGLLGWTASKAIIVDKQSKKIEANWYPYTHKKYQLFAELTKSSIIQNPIKRLWQIISKGPALESHAQKPRG